MRMLLSLFLGCLGISVISIAYAAYPASSTDLTPPSPGAKIKRINIDRTNTWTVGMSSGTGCGADAVAIGVQAMPNANYSLSTMSEEYSFDFHGETFVNFPCSRMILVGPAYSYYTSANSGWIQWVGDYGLARIVCARMTVEWQ